MQEKSFSTEIICQHIWLRFLCFLPILIAVILLEMYTPERYDGMFTNILSYLLYLILFGGYYFATRQSFPYRVSVKLNASALEMRCAKKTIQIALPEISEVMLIKRRSFMVLHIISDNKKIHLYSMPFSINETSFPLEELFSRLQEQAVHLAPAEIRGEVDPEWLKRKEPKTTDFS